MCYRCGEYMHYQNWCSLPEGAPPCWHCPNLKDHYTHDCPKQRPSTSAHQVMVSDYVPLHSHLISVTSSPSLSTHIVSPHVGTSTTPQALGVVTHAQRLGKATEEPSQVSAAAPRFSHPGLPSFSRPATPSFSHPELPTAQLSRSCIFRCFQSSTSRSSPK